MLYLSLRLYLHASIGGCGTLTKRGGAISTARKYIPYRRATFAKASHEWLDDRCRTAVAAKRAAQGTPSELARTSECSKVLLQTFHAHRPRLRVKLRALPRGSKKWWRLNKQLMKQTKPTTSVPPLKRNDGSWAASPVDRANLLAETFEDKGTLPDGGEEIV